MNDEQFLRYSRHMALPPIGLAGQRKLLASRVLLVGVGGLGSPIAMYLAASGVGRLVLADFDVVELSNLQRQIIHHTTDLGRAKVESGRERVNAINPDVVVDVIARVFDRDDPDLASEVTAADVVVDATDNFETRFALNRACVETGTPLVSGAALRMDGQVTVFQPRLPESPCYRCLYVDTTAEGEACSDVGVFSPLLGIIGSVQAAETIKLIVGAGETLTGRVLVIDALDMDWRILRLKRDPECPVCGRRP
jgi:adenylyltransferase/sulfurtransferase